MRMLFSIITVCYNSESTIERCLESVYRIETSNFEYIIVDGLSSDSTCKIIENWIPKLNLKGIKTKYISEKDSGIYNAMNKAIALAEGLWALFLNSDDYLICYGFDDFLRNRDASIGVIYGDVIVKSGDEEIYQEARPLSNLLCGWEMPFCHQATFTKVNLLKEYFYDESFRIIADIDLYARLYLDGVRFLHIECAISVFSNDGVSQTNRIESIKEGKKLLKKHHQMTPRKWFVLELYEFWYLFRRFVPKNKMFLINKVKSFVRG